jgi:hypothetical protein
MEMLARGGGGNQKTAGLKPGSFESETISKNHRRQIKSTGMKALPAAGGQPLQLREDTASGFARKAGTACRAPTEKIVDVT